MDTSTENYVRLRGYVGKYIKISNKIDEASKFDVVTIEKYRTQEGGFISHKDWHTILCWNASLLTNLKSGDMVEISGRLKSRLADGNKIVEVELTYFRIVLTSEERRIIKENYFNKRGLPAFYDGEGEIEWDDGKGKSPGNTTAVEV
jgi:hypothetical protein